MKTYKILSVLFLLTVAALANDKLTGPATVRYKEVIVRCIKEGKRDFSAVDATRASIITSVAKEQYFAVKTQKVENGTRVFLFKAGDKR